MSLLGVEFIAESLLGRRAHVLNLSAHRVVLGLAFIFVCGCQLAKHIERNTEAIDENRRNVEKSTQTIRDNASAIDESTAKIVANGNAVADASQAIAANAAIVGQSTVGIEANRIITEKSAHAIDENRAAIESNTYAIRENERMVRESTATLMKNATALQNVAIVFETIDANRRLFALISCIGLILLVAPTILMLMTLRRTERVLNSAFQTYRTRIDPPEGPIQGL